MAQPKIDIEKIQHLMEGADTHLTTHNKAAQDLQFQKAAIMALILIAEELDQIGDALAVMAELKDPGDVTLT